jgi:hypothetical protein
MAWYSGEDPERRVFWNRLFGHYWWATWIMLICNGFIPIMLWFKRVRHSIAALFVISIFINIGMWFERYVIIVTSLSTSSCPSPGGSTALGDRDGDRDRNLRLVLLLVPPLHPAPAPGGDRRDQGSPAAAHAAPKRRRWPDEHRAAGGPGLLRLPGLTVDAIKKLREEGFEEITAFAPFPSTTSSTPSGTREPGSLFTLVGGLTGMPRGSPSRSSRPWTGRW